MLTRAEAEAMAATPAQRPIRDTPLGKNLISSWHRVATEEFAEDVPPEIREAVSKKVKEGMDHENWLFSMGL